jgi:hypothetical protein
MSESKVENIDKTEIMGQIATMSRLLGMIPVDETNSIEDPYTSETMELSAWFAETRDAFLQLSLLVGRALDLPFQ